MLTIIAPALITVIGNYLFYIFIKNDVDKSLELYKISYSGLFKEKIDIYRTLLSYIVEIQSTLVSYHYTLDESIPAELKASINKFITFIRVNRPFLSKNIIANLDIIKARHSDVFESVYIVAKTFHTAQNEQMAANYNRASAAIKKLESEEFKSIKQNIIDEMTKDLNRVI